MFEKILVAVDGSEHSHAAIRYACDLAGRYGSSMHFVHVPEGEVGTLTLGAGSVPWSDAAKRLGAEIAEKARGWAKAAGREPDSVDVLQGDAAQAILEYAELNDIELIVSGRRGLGGLRGLLQGSVSQKLASHAACPVLTVK